MRSRSSGIVTIRVKAGLQVGQGCGAGSCWSGEERREDVRSDVDAAADAAQAVARWACGSRVGLDVDAKIEVEVEAERLDGPARSLPSYVAAVCSAAHCAVRTGGAPGIHTASMSISVGGCRGGNLCAWVWGRASFLLTASSGTCPCHFRSPRDSAANVKICDNIFYATHWQSH